MRKKNSQHLKVLSVLTLVFTLFLVSSVSYGYSFRLKKVEIYFKDLPKSFDGFKIVHVSDFHIGNFKKRKTVERGVNLINKQNADIVMFTGDMVTVEASETEKMKDILQTIKSKLGKYAVLGNHDMGDYMFIRQIEDKINNIKKLVKYEEEMGFKVLRNENTYVKINSDSIAILGVDNWGLPPYKKDGILSEALKGLPEAIFKILLTHNPRHWREEILKKTTIDLSLCGHTHGGQIGFSVGKVKWSPAKAHYPEWWGLYQEDKQYLYVNRGFGYVFAPIRPGMPAEITLITLRCKEN